MKTDVQRLAERYEKEIKPKLSQEFAVKNIMAVPKVIKVVVNSGIGDTIKDKALLDQAISDLEKITGQHPSLKLARISVASFGIRTGMKVGLSVVLRKDRMYSFLDKLFSIVLPRLRDFRGVSKKSFDKKGNYTLGFKDHTVFPEIDITKSKPRGLEVTIVTNAKDDERAFKLIQYLGMPFEK